MCDLISRQAAIDALIRAGKPINNGDGTSTIMPLTNAVIREVLTAVPSVQPDMSGYSDRLWKLAYERGKRDAYTEMEGEKNE